MASICTSLSLVSLHSAKTFPEPLPPIFTNEPMADKPLKLLLLLHSLEFQDFLDLLVFEGLVSGSEALLIILAATRLAMQQRQKGQAGASETAVTMSGFLWQQRARVQ